jgi:RND superfamily putative drug exporter
VFQALGNLISRTWPLWLIAWVALFVAAWWTAPRFSDIAVDEEYAFLPPDMPSRQAEEVFQKAFPDNLEDSNIVLVISRDQPLQPADRQFIDKELRTGILKIAQDEGGLASEPGSAEPINPFSEAPPPPQKKSIIARLHTPDTPGVGALLLSRDRQAALLVAELTTEFMTRTNWPTLQRIEGLVRDLQQQGRVPPGLDIQLTGSAVVGRDRAVAQLQSVQATGIWTVVLIVALLVIIYRAPFLALIPLLTVYLAVQFALHVLAILAEHHYLTVFEGLEIYITVVAYGAGVDYCLFLMARYKEELDACVNRRQALANALGHVGPALTASAATVMCGIGMMMSARFGKFREAGFAMPLSILVVLCGTLTFSAPLLLLAGRWAFWPRRDWRGCGAGEQEPPAPDRIHRWWQHGANVLLRYPGSFWLTAFLTMLPFAALALATIGRLNYDWVKNLPDSAPSVAGTRVLQAHFPPGLMGPTSVLLVNHQAHFDSDDGRAQVAELTAALMERRQQLGISDLRTLTEPLGITGAGERSLRKLNVSDHALEEGLRQQALQHFASELGGRGYIGTRLEVIFDHNPFSAGGIAALQQLEATLPELLPAGLRQGTQIYYTGATASTWDLKKVTSDDELRIASLVLASVFVILLLVLRKLLVSVYLILSVLFSYFTALGITIAVFWAISPQTFSGLDWKVSLFLFTILIAIGEDYNILLMARVREEQQRHGMVHGVSEALTRTGPIISSCGVIMADTFASLMAGSLREMIQLGFALTIGVLLDTFVVRPILVPAFLVLLHERRLDLRPWWRRGRVHLRRSRQPQI